MDCATMPAGRYVVAISGGVDSVVLLDYLSRQNDLQLTVAHLDHGIRADSAEDALFVRQLAKKYGYAFATEKAGIGPQASEAAARRARYEFLRRVQQKASAQAIITAHHQDDVLETALINLWRGTGWRGLCSLRDTTATRRPFLAVPKADILAYAAKYKLQWREDSTNTDQRYLRNYIRHAVVTKMNMDVRQQFLALLARQNELVGSINQLTDSVFDTVSIDLVTSDGGKLAEGALPKSDGTRAASEVDAVILNRYALIMLPKEVAKEVLSETVHRLTGGRLEQHMLHRMWLFVKVAKSHKTLQASKQITMKAQKTTVVVHSR